MMKWWKERLGAVIAICAIWVTLWVTIGWIRSELRSRTGGAGCRDQVSLLAVGRDAPDEHSCGDVRHHMRVEFRPNASVVFCECPRAASRAAPEATERR